MYTARYLGAEGFGVLSFALAFAGMFGVFSDLGARDLTVREVARDKSLAKKYLANISTMKLIQGIITFGLITVTINAFSYPEQTIIVVYLVAFSVIFGAFSGMFYSIFQAYEKMEWQSLGQILSSVLMLLGALFAISRELDVISFAYIYFVVNAIVLGYAFAVCSWKFVIPMIEIDWEFWKATIKKALPFGLTGIVVTIYYQIDTVMLSLMVPNANEAVGWYNASYRLVLALLFIPSAYYLSVFPIMSRFYKNSKNSLKFIHDRSFKYATMIAIPIGVGTTLLASRIILLIFGSEYHPSIIALQILIWSSVFIFVNGTYSTLLNSTNKQFNVTKIAVIGMIVNVSLNFIFIPIYSYVGASITTVFTEFVALLGLMFYSPYNIDKAGIKDILSKVFISTLVMAVFIEYFKTANLLFLILISIALYFGVLCAIKGFDEIDILLIKKVTKMGENNE